MDPEARVSEPDNSSDPTSEPLVTDHVRSGSDVPYSLDLTSAVTVIGRGSKVTVVADDDTGL